jgi:hypothetical protein
MADADWFHRWFYLVLMVVVCASSLYCLAGIVSWLAREGLIGRLVVDAGRPRSTGRICIWIVYALLWVAAAVIEPAHYVFSFSTVILISSGTALLLGDALEVREGGIFCHCLIISWKRVKNWCWEDVGGAKQFQWSGKFEPGAAMMRVELVRPLFFRRCVRLRVPFARVDAVERAVAARVHQQ